jgi:nucleoid DNA-binding protein
MSDLLNKTELARRLARQSRVSRAEAADSLDQTLMSILKDWKRGRAAQLPGVGELKKHSIVIVNKKVTK